MIDVLNRLVPVSSIELERMERMFIMTFDSVLSCRIWTRKGECNTAERTDRKPGD